MLMNMAYDAAHGVQPGWNLFKLAAIVNFQLPRLIVLTHLDADAFDKESGISAVDKILLQAEHGNFVFVRFSLPWTELGAIAAFVAISVQMQRLEAILEARYGDGNIGAVRADIYALAANVVALQATAGFLLNKGVTLVFIHQRDGDGAFTLINLRRIDIAPDFVSVAAGDIFPGQNHVRCPSRVADC